MKKTDIVIAILICITPPIVACLLNPLFSYMFGYDFTFVRSPGFGELFAAVCIISILIAIGFLVVKD